MEKTAQLMLIATFVSTFLIEDCSGLRDVKLEIPEYVARGRDIRLTCKYNLENDTLYAVKFYKGPPFQEFYRFLPKEVPPHKTFPVPGISIDVSLSNAHDVVFTNVPLEITGNYKCVVSAESTFQTLSASADLTALVIGDDRPFVQVERSEYNPGDQVIAHCRAPASLPPANLTWYINDEEVDEETSGIKTRTKTGSHEGNSEIDSALTKWSQSVIEFDLSGNVTPVQIKCRAYIYSAYDKSTTLTIHPVPRRLSGPDTLLRSHGVRVSSYLYELQSWRRPSSIAFTTLCSFVQFAQLLFSNF